MSTTLTNSFDCKTCDYRVQHRGTDAVMPCPQCGGQNWEGSIVVQDTATHYGELGATATNEEGKIVLERIQKTDLNTNANFAANLGEPSKISVDRKTRVSKDDEEGSAAAALVNSFNKRNGTSYKVKDKTKGDHIYPDSVFISENDTPDCIDIQTTNLDKEIIAKIGSRKSFSGDRTAADIIASIRTAINKKTNVDSNIKPKTILQLCIPSPIGLGIRQAIEKTIFSCQGFKEIWISPFHEESFPLSLS